MSEMQQLFEQALGAAVTDLKTQAWSSLLFKGARHRFALKAESQDDYSRIRSRITGPDLELDGHIVADMRIAETDGYLVIVDALTIEVSQ